jgi:membrane protein
MIGIDAWIVREIRSDEIRWSVGVVYGSLATTIVGLLSLEIASIILLLGAQVIAEYEGLQDGYIAVPGERKTEPARAEVH